MKTTLISPKAIGITAALFAATAAHANTVIEATPDTMVSVKKSIQLEISQKSAQQIFDALTVTATPGWEDVQVSSKSAAGLDCTNEDAPAGRYTSCDIQVSPTLGVVDAVKKANADVVLSLNGAPAGAIYNALAVREESENPEFYDWIKSVPGVSCQRHSLTSGYDCVIWMDRNFGIVQ
jgi:hypothetical protein